MTPETKRQITDALRDRLESDAILGASALPIVPPRTKAAIAPGATPVPTPRAQPAPNGASPAADAGPVAPPPEQLSEAEIDTRRAGLEAIDRDEVKPCAKCGLSRTRNNTVFGVGSPTARIMFVGEAPGRDEDMSGIPFVGRAGELLTKMIENGMGLSRNDVYICNVLKCRPPDNRDPAPDETLACKDYLFRQIETIHPQIIVALGSPAAKLLLNRKEGITKLRGRLHDFYPSGSSLVGDSIPLAPTYHPAYLLRSPHEKAKAWADLKMVMRYLQIPLPQRG